MKQNHLRFYFPGLSEDQPYKEDKFRYCYTFFKRISTKRQKNDIGDVSKKL